MNLFRWDNVSEVVFSDSPKVFHLSSVPSATPASGKVTVNLLTVGLAQPSSTPVVQGDKGLPGTDGLVGGADDLAAAEDLLHPVGAPAHHPGGGE